MSGRGAVAAILLAAGESRRLGRAKQLLTLRGRPLVRAMAEKALATCDDVAVVVGANASAVTQALEGLPVVTLLNERWTEGMGSSIRVGAAWAAVAPPRAGVVLLACDQPRLTARHLRHLVATYRQGARVVASRYDGVLGVPALFDRSLLPQLLALSGAHGARDLLRRDGVTAVDWPQGAFDIDTPDDAAALDASSGATLTGLD